MPKLTETEVVERISTYLEDISTQDLVRLHNHCFPDNPVDFNPETNEYEIEELEL